MAALWQQRAKLQVGKDKWADGDMKVIDDRISFTGLHNVQIMLTSITALQKAKGAPVIRVVSSSGAKIFQLQSVDAREAFLGVVNPMWKGAAHGSNSKPSAAVPSVDVQKAVFSSNPEIKTLHERFVTPGHITEAEFWASKKAALKAVKGDPAAGQKPGLSTQVLSLLNAPKLSITPAMEQQIFAESPALAAVYAQTVPHVRSRDQFFEQYIVLLRNRVERRRKRVAGILSETDKLLTDFEEEVARCEADMRAQRRNAAARRIATADPTVNVAADDNERGARGWGTCHAPGREDENISTAGATASDLASELNTHAATVLDGWLGTGAGSKGNGSRPNSGRAPDRGDVVVLSEDVRRRAQSGLEDLRKKEAPTYEPLEIQDPKKYFMRSAAGVQDAAVKPEPVTNGDNDMESMQVDEDDEGGLSGGVQRMKRKLVEMHATKAGHETLTSMLIEPADALQALKDMREETQLDGEVGEGGRRLNPISVLPAAIVAGLKQQAVGVNELLRHFWMCFPLSTPARKSKAQRMANALDELRKHSDALRCSAAQEHRQYVSQLLHASTEALHVALDKFDSQANAAT